MAVLELTLQQSYLEQQIITRWNYVSTGGSPNTSKSYALADVLGFVNPELIPEAGTSFFSIIRTLQSQITYNYQVSVRDVHSETDFYAKLLSGAQGVNAGQYGAPFLAFGFRTNQTTKRVRPGQKRLVGVRDEDTTTNGDWTGTTASQMDLVASAMSEVRIYDPSGENITFSPAVCARMAYTTPSGSTAYKYYPTVEEQMQNTALGIVWSRKQYVRSQTTRQRGRGI